MTPPSVPPRRIARGARASPAPRSRVVARRASRSKKQKPSFLSSRVAPASRPRARHARPRSRGSPQGGGTSRSRHEKSEITTWRNASNLTRRAQSSAEGAGHLEAREPRTRIRLGWSAPCPGRGDESLDRKMPNHLRFVASCQKIMSPPPRCLRKSAFPRNLQTDDEGTIFTNNCVHYFAAPLHRSTLPGVCS